MYVGIIYCLVNYNKLTQSPGIKNNDSVHNLRHTVVPIHDRTGVVLQRLIDPILRACVGGHIFQSLIHMFLDPPHGHLRNFHQLIADLRDSVGMADHLRY